MLRNFHSFLPRFMNIHEYANPDRSLTDERTARIRAHACPKCIGHEWNLIYGVQFISDDLCGCVCGCGGVVMSGGKLKACSTFYTFSPKPRVQWITSRVWNVCVSLSAGGGAAVSVASSCCDSQGVRDQTEGSGRHRGRGAQPHGHDHGAAQRRGERSAGTSAELHCWTPHKAV